MKKIDITGGYVVLKDFVTRKVSREYLDVLSEHSNTREDGSLAITSKAVSAASEFLLLKMVDKVVMVGADGSETEMEADSDWLDNLRNEDFVKLSEKVLKQFNEGRASAKK